MLDKRLIREESGKVKNSVLSRGIKLNIDRIISMDSELLKSMQANEKLKHERNIKSEEIARLKRDGKDAEELLQYMKNISGKIKLHESREKELAAELDKSMLMIPNIPHESVPIGPEADKNEIVRSWGVIPEKYFDIKPHWEIGEELNLLDLEAGTQVTGRGFIVFRSDGALLSRALVNLMLDMHRAQGYEEILVPYLASRDSMIGTGQLPKLEEDMYHCEVDDLFLIPTSEVPLTNIYRRSSLSFDNLPIKLTTYSPCFRREAGSYGTDTRGLLRVHQFDKVEMVKFVHPDESYDELEKLVVDAAEVIEALELPYRVVSLCTGDLSFSAAKCYDLEVYSPGVGKWLEVSSCSNFEAFQARRAGIKLKKTPGEKHKFVHTLNGSGLALPRIIAAIFECHQTPTHRIKLPQKLVPYMNGKEYLG